MYCKFYWIDIINRSAGLIINELFSITLLLIMSSSLLGWFYTGRYVYCVCIDYKFSSDRFHDINDWNEYEEVTAHDMKKMWILTQKHLLAKGCFLFFFNQSMSSYWVEIRNGCSPLHIGVDCSRVQYML